MYICNNVCGQYRKFWWRWCEYNPRSEPILDEDDDDGVSQQRRQKNKPGSVVTQLHPRSLCHVRQLHVYTGQQRTSNHVKLCLYLPHSEETSEHSRKSTNTPRPHRGFVFWLTCSSGTWTLVNQCTHTTSYFSMLLLTTTAEPVNATPTKGKEKWKSSCTQISSGQTGFIQWTRRI